MRHPRRHPPRRLRPTLRRSYEAALARWDAVFGAAIARRDDGLVALALGALPVTPEWPGRDRRRGHRVAVDDFLHEHDGAFTAPEMVAAIAALAAWMLTLAAIGQRPLGWPVPASVPAPRPTLRLAGAIEPTGPPAWRLPSEAPAA